MKAIIKSLIQKGWVFTPSPVFSTEFCYNLANGFNTAWVYTYSNDTAEELRVYAIYRDTHDGPFTEIEEEFDLPVNPQEFEGYLTVLTEDIISRPRVIDPRTLDENIQPVPLDT